MGMYSSFMQYNEVLVTGGTGLAGPYVCRALLDRGVLPRLFVRPKSEGKIPPEIRSKCRVSPGDLTVREFVEFGAQGTSAIIHLGGAWKESRKEGVVFEQAIVHATGNVLHAAKAWGIGRLIYGSVTGARPGDPIPFLDAKGRAEESVRNSGLAWTVFRTEPFYDLRDGRIRVTAEYLQDFAAGVADALFLDDAIGCIFEGPGPHLLLAGRKSFAGETVK